MYGFKNKENNSDHTSGRSASRNAWLITYADMVTVLLTFFVMIFIYMKEAESSIDRWINALLNQTYTELNHYVQENNVEGIKVDRVTKGIRIILSSGVVFDPGYADLKSNALPVLSEVGALINNSTLVHIEENPEYADIFNNLEQQGRELNVDIRVEGHTDSDPYYGREFDSNWDLSAARALAVVQYISESTGLEERKFSALGYGEYRPIVPNTSESNKQRNRRVEIYLDANLVAANGLSSNTADHLN